MDSGWKETCLSADSLHRSRVMGRRAAIHSNIPSRTLLNLRARVETESDAV